MLEQMLDFDGRIIGESRKFLMQGFDKRNGMSDAVKKIRIAERDVLGAGGHLLANISENHVALDHAKNSVIDRHNGAMAAQMFAAAARFRVTHRALFAVRQNQSRVL